ncbi:MAG: DUF2303 family protein [Myxococcales bacterium]|nr:DUF2303 family protein [Myxococcales bacterium]
MDKPLIDIAEFERIFGQRRTAYTLDTKAGQVLVTPSGVGTNTVELVDQLDDTRRQDGPLRPRTTLKVYTLAAFLVALDRYYQEDRTVVYADTLSGAPALEAVFDDDQLFEALVGCGADLPEHRKRPLTGWREHRARYEFPLSDEWRAWVGSAGKPMDQATFATWLEDRVLDVVDPIGTNDVTRDLAEQLRVTMASPSKLLDLSRGLAVKVEETIHQVVLLDSGETQMQWKTEHKDELGERIRVPNGFAIAIPVFVGGPTVEVLVRLRYKASGGKVNWRVEPIRLRKALEQSVQTAAFEVAAHKEGLTVIEGVAPPVAEPNPKAAA